MKKPSVTDLISLLDKPALLTWANKLGLEGIDIKEKRKNSMKKGSSFHKQIEDCLNGLESPFENKCDEDNFKIFMRGKDVVSIEKEIETEWFVGRYDLKMRFANKEFIIDWKSGHKGKIYLENKLQLVAYAMADSADELAIVGIPDFKFTHVPIANRGIYIKMLIKLSELYYIKQEIDAENTYKRK